MCDCVVYNTPMNTIGVGDPVPFGINSYGSGDRFDTTPGSKSKIKIRKYILNLQYSMDLTELNKCR